MATAVQTQEARVAKAAHLLRTDDLYYCENVVQLVNKDAETVPMTCKQAQRRLIAVKARLEALGLPVRIITVKARQEGISTGVQALGIKRLTQRENHRMLVVAHDKKTAAQIFEIGETMYAKLPDEVIGDLVLKPPVAGGAKGQEIIFGQPNRAARLTGDRGLNSKYLVDTANEYDAGRGFTFHTLHLSEYAFWKDAEKKGKAILSSVPDRPGTMIVIESTANGYNAFRRRWVAAVSGKGGYVALFIAWYEDPEYVLPFANLEDREAFIAQIGTGEYGEAEPELLNLGVSLEQLHWRRQAIEDKSEGDLRAFWQEYPANWEEAFLATGRQVFAPVSVSKVIARTEATEKESARGALVEQDWEKSAYMGREIEVPRKPIWVPSAQVGPLGRQLWQVWDPPDRGLASADPAEARTPGQYVVNVDSASGRETASEGSDYFAIQVVDHRTKAQVAQWHARGIDADIVAREAFLACQFYTVEIELPDGTKRLWRPWLGVETTGGYGVSIATKIYKVWRYPMLYFRKPMAQKGDHEEDRLGWSTDVATKPLIVDHAKELLRAGQDGIRSKTLAGEMQTYVKDPKTGKMGAEEDYFDDLLECWMIAQFIAQEKPLRRVPTSSQRRLHRAPTMNVRPQNLRRR
jgi:hypothetical protein